MVLRLAGALDLPLRQQNALLLAAGFAPAWRQRDLAAPELAEVNRALTFMLEQQEPYPAFVVDRRWNLLRANAGAGRFVEFLLGPAPPAALGAPPPNLAEALLAPDALRPFIINWEETARFFLRGVQADAAADGTNRRAAGAPPRLPRPPLALRRCRPTKPRRRCSRSTSARVTYRSACSRRSRRSARRST
jgi:hypothetical protein